MSDLVERLNRRGEADVGMATTTQELCLEAAARIKELETETEKLCSGDGWSERDYYMESNVKFAARIKALEAENARLTERLGPRGLVVVMIDGRGHYVNEKVAARITELERELDKAARVLADELAEHHALREKA